MLNLPSKSNLHYVSKYWYKEIKTPNTTNPITRFASHKICLNFPAIGLLLLLDFSLSIRRISINSLARGYHSTVVYFLHSALLLCC